MLTAELTILGAGLRDRTVFSGFSDQRYHQTSSPCINVLRGDRWVTIPLAKRFTASALAIWVRPHLSALWYSVGVTIPSLQLERLLTSPLVERSIEIWHPMNESNVPTNLRRIQANSLGWGIKFWLPRYGSNVRPNG